MIKRACFALLLILFSGHFSAVYSQSISSDSTTFDFWVGHWDLTWTTKTGETAYGTNHIERILGGTVIQENFKAAEDGPLNGYSGKSWSMIDKRTGEWKQTWVDSQGAYLPFTGGKLPDGTPYFGRKIQRNGQPVWQRMRFVDISMQGFTWIWESSRDSTNWQTAWKIIYKRAES